MNPTSLYFPRELQNNFKKKNKVWTAAPDIHTRVLCCVTRVECVVDVGERLTVPKGKQGTVKWPKENAREVWKWPQWRLQCNTKALVLFVMKGRGSGASGYHSASLQNPNRCPGFSWVSVWWQFTGYSWTWSQWSHAAGQWTGMSGIWPWLGTAGSRSGRRESTSLSHMGLV